MFRLGETTITKLFDLDLNDFKAKQLLPDLTDALLDKHPQWLDPRVYDKPSGKVFLSVHTWLVRHNGKNILIDTSAGNDKPRPTLEVLDHLNTPYLQRLHGLGVDPEQIDYILLTHIHADHVGWNTRWNGSAWVPTFPNATVFCSDIEWRYASAMAAKDEGATAAVRREAGLGDPLRTPVAGVFEDSMLPLEALPLGAQGRLQRVKVDGTEVLDGVRFLPAAGHSIDHAAISVISGGEEAVFGGDIIHHPFELYDPELVSMFCEFPEAARTSRRRLASYVADSADTLLQQPFPPYLRRPDREKWRRFLMAVHGKVEISYFTLGR